MRFTYREHINPMRETLAQRFPNTFRRRHTKTKWPLAVGIREMIAERAPDLDQQVVAVALRDYTNGWTYLQSMIDGAPRRDLDGATAGFVTLHEARHAQVRKEYREKKIAAQQQAAA